MSAVNPKDRSSLPGWAKLLIVVVVLLALGATVVHLLDNAAQARWERYAAKLRESGDPLTFEEIEDRRTLVPEGHNGARVIEGLSAELEGLWNARVIEYIDLGRFASQVDLFSGIPRYMLDPTRRFVEEHRQALAELKRLRDLPSGRFVLSHAPNPIYTLLPHLTPVRTAAELAHVQGTLRAINGDLERAAESVEIVFHIGGTLREEPITVSRVTEVAIDTLALRLLESILRAGELQGETLGRLSDEVEMQLADNTMKWSWLGERACFIGVCDQIATGNVSLSSIIEDFNLPQRRTGGVEWFPEITIRESQAHGAEMLTWLIDAGDDPKALMSATDRIQAELSGLPESQAVVKLLISPCATAIERHLAVTAHLWCARIALAAERFRVRTGRLPASIGELIPEHLDSAPIDPFDGQPMRLTSTDRGIIIYSIGEDLADDNGSVATPEGETRPRDLGFRLFKLDRRGVLLTDEAPPRDD